MERGGARDFSVRRAEVPKLDFALVLLRDSHANILAEPISGICSLVHTCAGSLGIGPCVLEYQPENRGAQTFNSPKDECPVDV